MHRFGQPGLLLFAGIILQITTLAQKDSAGYFSSFDKVKIYYEVRGTGKPVLLIHGFTGKGSDWKTKPVYDSLIAAGFKVITADLRGNGYSDKPHGGCPILNTSVEADDNHPLLKKKVKQTIHSWKGNIESMIEKGKAVGLIKKEADPSKYALVFISLMEGSLMLTKITGDLAFLDEAMEKLKRIILYELKK